MKNSVETIYVALLDEDLDVWLPVRAERLDARTFRILERDYDPKLEAWAFGPGEIVSCTQEDRPEGKCWFARKRVSHFSQNFSCLTSAAEI